MYNLITQSFTDDRFLRGREAMGTNLCPHAELLRSCSSAVACVSTLCQLFNLP